jgi:hypothetical protein
VGLVAGAPDTALPWSVFGSGGSTASSSASYDLGSTAGQTAIGSAGSAGFQLGGGFWYGVCAVGSASDIDCDATADATETACGSNAGNAASIPERIDGVFAGVDDDGDTQVDDALPGGAEAFDCDGDGYKGSAEAAIYSPSTLGDQDPCGLNGWPSDFVSGGIFESTDQVDIADLNSFLSPRRLDTSPGDPNFSARWDLQPGAGIFGPAWINIADLNALLGGTSGNPPMLGGARAFDGPVCPWPG